MGSQISSTTSKQSMDQPLTEQKTRKQLAEIITDFFTKKKDHGVTKQDIQTTLSEKKYTLIPYDKWQIKNICTLGLHCLYSKKKAIKNPQIIFLPYSGKNPYKELMVTLYPCKTTFDSTRRKELNERTESLATILEARGYQFPTLFNETPEERMYICYQTILKIFSNKTQSNDKETALIFFITEMIRVRGNDTNTSKKLLDNLKKYQPGFAEFFETNTNLIQKQKKLNDEAELLATMLKIRDYRFPTLLNEKPEERMYICYQTIWKIFSDKDPRHNKNTALIFFIAEMIKAAGDDKNTLEKLLAILNTYQTGFTEFYEKNKSLIEAKINKQ